MWNRIIQNLNIKIAENIFFKTGGEVDNCKKIITQQEQHKKNYFPWKLFPLRLITVVIKQITRVLQVQGMPRA